MVLTFATFFQLRCWPVKSPHFLWKFVDFSYLVHCNKRVCPIKKTKFIFKHEVIIIFLYLQNQNTLQPKLEQKVTCFIACNQKIFVILDDTWSFVGYPCFYFWHFTNVTQKRSFSFDVNYNANVNHNKMKCPFWMFPA